MKQANDKTTGNENDIEIITYIIMAVFGFLIGIIYFIIQLFKKEKKDKKETEEEILTHKAKPLWTAKK